MTILEAILLGVIQGLTEFLPISSSGHLVLFQHFLGFREPMLAFDVMVHLGTLLAVLIYFARDLLDCLRRPVILFWVAVATLPAVGVGLFLRDQVEALFGLLAVVGAAWVGTGIFLILSQKFQHGQDGLEKMTAGKALWIGAAQALDIIPGVSRAGATIVAGMYAGVEREQAAKFSFFMAIPAIAGAGVLEMRHGIEWAAGPAVLAAGFAASAVVGLLAIHVLMRLLRRGSFYAFGFYCLALGVLTLVYSFL